MPFGFVSFLLRHLLFCYFLSTSPHSIRLPLLPQVTVCISEVGFFKLSFPQEFIISTSVSLHL